MNKEYQIYAFDEEKRETYVLADDGFKKSVPNVQERRFLRDEAVQFLENEEYHSVTVTFPKGEYKLYACHFSGGDGLASRKIQITS